MNIKSFFLLIFIFLQTGIIFSQLDEGLAFYKEKKFDKSLTAFLQVVAAGGQGEDLYYNVGNVYYQMQKYPEAILYYKKALRWNPNCNPCKDNLAIANQAAGIDVYQVPDFFLIRYYKTILHTLSPLGWLLSASILCCVGVILYGIGLSVLSKSQRKLILQCISFLALFALLASFHSNHIRMNLSEGILLEAHGLYISPDPTSEKKEDMLPGQVLWITDKIGDWIKVKTQSFDVGWIKESAFGYITL